MNDYITYFIPWIKHCYEVFVYRDLIRKSNLSPIPASLPYFIQNRKTYEKFLQTQKDNK